MKKTATILLMTTLLYSCGSDSTYSENMSSEDLKDISADCNCSEVDFKRDVFGNSELDKERQKIESGVYKKDLLGYQKSINKPTPLKYRNGEIFTGTCEEKWGDESRKEIQQYSQGKLHGKLAKWGEQGNLRLQLNFKNGKQDGKQMSWHENGQMNSLLNFSNGTKHGNEKTWNDKGKIIFECERKDGDIIESGFEYEELGMVKSIWKNIDYSKKNNKNVKSIQIENASNSGEYNLEINDKLADKQIIEFIKEDVLKKHFNNDPTKFVISTDGGWHEPHIYLASDVYGKGYEKNKESFRIATMLLDNIKGIQIPLFEKKKNVDYYKVKNGCENIRVLVKAINGNYSVNRYRDVCDFEWFQVNNVVENQAEILLTGNIKGFILASKIERISGDKTIEVEKNEQVQNFENDSDFSKISDPDGYSNLRDTPNGNVIQKVYENELFEVIGDEDGYKKVKFSDGTVGYIHGSRVIKN